MVIRGDGGVCERERERAVEKSNLHNFNSITHWLEIITGRREAQCFNKTMLVFVSIYVSMCVCCFCKSLKECNFLRLENSYEHEKLFLWVWFDNN